jgi:hypothetical protein
MVRVLTLKVLSDLGSGTNLPERHLFVKPLPPVERLREASGVIPERLEGLQKLLARRL